MIAATGHRAVRARAGAAGRQRPAAYSPALIAAVLAGACLGFLPHNFNPARIFMGDSGSMLIGLLLAAATTSASGRMPQRRRPTAPTCWRCSPR